MRDLVHADRVDTLPLEEIACGCQDLLTMRGDFVLPVATAYIYRLSPPAPPLRDPALSTRREKPG